MEGTAERMMMMKRSERSNGAMANNKEVEIFHLDAKCNNK
jgi:hypothetical protein